MTLLQEASRRVLTNFDQFLFVFSLQCASPMLEEQFFTSWMGSKCTHYQSIYKGKAQFHPICLWDIIN